MAMPGTAKSRYAIEAANPTTRIMPQLLFGDLKRPSHGIITIMCRSPEFSVLPELAQLAKSTHDPAIRRENAERFFRRDTIKPPRNFLAR